MKINNIRDFAAIGDGISDDTSAIQAAIDAGGMTLFPPGIYISGTIYLHNRTHLHLEEGAVLRATADLSRYNAWNFCPQNTKSKLEYTSGAHLIVALDKSDILIDGKGKIDGAMGNWFKEIGGYWAGTLHQGFVPPEVRPSQLLFFCECRNVSLHEITLFNSPYWTCFFYGCNGVNVNGITIRNNEYGHNGDGIDLDCVQNAVIENCDISASDDCITLRSCSARLSHPMDCENIIVRNCVLATRQAGIRIGLGNGTAIRNARFSNIKINRGGYGIMINASWRNDPGAHISDIHFEDMSITAYRPICSVLAIASDHISTGSIRDISFRNIRALGVYSSVIAGLESNAIKNVLMENVEWDAPEPSGGGIWECFEQGGQYVLCVRYVHNFIAKNVIIRRHPDWHAGLLENNNKNCYLQNCSFDELCHIAPKDKWLPSPEGYQVFADTQEY